VKKGILVTSTILVLLIVLRPFVLDYLDLLNYNREIENLQIQNPEISAFEDGEYEGRHQVHEIEAQVEVRILSGEIVGIDLHHEHERGYNAEEITRRVVEEQSLEVDMVTGATHSSKVILKAIERALCETEEVYCEEP